MKIAEKNRKAPPMRTEILTGGVNVMPLLRQRRLLHGHRLPQRGPGQSGVRKLLGWYSHSRGPARWLWSRDRYRWKSEWMLPCDGKHGDEYGADRWSHIYCNATLIIDINTIIALLLNAGMVYL